MYVLLVDLILLFLEASFKLLVSVLVPSPIVFNPSPNVADPAANWLDPELIFNAPSANCEAPLFNVALFEASVPKPLLTCLTPPV